MPAPIRSMFTWRIRVYYEDTDAAGIVYHANFLRFCERARTEWLRSLGFEQAVLNKDWGITFVLVSTTVKFLTPARLDQELLVSVQPQRIRNASLEFEQSVLPVDRDEPAVQLAARVGCMNARTARPRAIPEQILRELRHDG